MRIITFLLLSVLFFASASAQCDNVKYTFSQKNCYIETDTLFFSVKNDCGQTKNVLYSLEYKDSTGAWQEVDNDLFTDFDKGIKILSLTSNKKFDFNFKLNAIDQFFFVNAHALPFRINENLYSDDKTQIVRAKTVKQFLVGCGKPTN